MITTNSGPKNWGEVPITTETEWAASRATVNFIAEASLSDKIQRVFNGTMFFIVGAHVLSYIPAIATTGSTLCGMGFAAISGTSLMQIPVVLTIITMAPKIISTLALIVVIRKVMAVAINLAIYQAVIFQFLISTKEKIDNLRWTQFEQLSIQGYECRRVALNISGISYDAFVIQHEKIKDNGQWVMIAGGNGDIGERSIDEYVKKFEETDLNILYVNGPGVGRSSGLPTSYSLRAGQEAGLQFLEKVVKATKVLLYGHSLGGGIQAEVIQHHRFVKEIDYMVWSDRSFDNVSHAASAMVTRLAKLFFLFGVKLDGVAGAKKLQELGFSHIVTQNSKAVWGDTHVLPLDGEIYKEEADAKDGVIPNKASLYVGLRGVGIQDSPRLKCYGNGGVSHCGPLPFNVQPLVNQDIQDFLKRV